MSITGYKISLNLYIHRYDHKMDHIDITDKIYDQFEWVYEKCTDEDCRKVDDIFEQIGLKNIKTVEDAKKSYTPPSKKELGEYVAQNGLDDCFIESLRYHFHVNGFEYNGEFDPETAAINITINKTSDLSTFNDKRIKNDIMNDSLEDGVYEGCYDEGYGFDIYTKVQIDVSDLIDFLKTLDYMKDDERLAKTTADLNLNVGVIDYRESIYITPINFKED